MTKELYVSNTPRETKVALVEDDQLAEVYFERENEYTLAGSIYKGRVTRVLPGMQSAFVDIGLERDAFLYVSDFLDLPEEDEDDFGEVIVAPQVIETRQQDARQAALPAEPLPAELGDEEDEGEDTEEGVAGEQEEASAGTEDDAGVRRWRGRRRRRGRRGGRERVPGAPETTNTQEVAPESQEEEFEPEVQASAPVVEDVSPSVPAPFAGFHGMPADYEPIVLPGESISKYRGDAEPRDESVEHEPAHEEHRFGGRGGRDRERGGGRFGGRGRGRGDRGDRGDRDRGREPRHREESEPLPADYAPIVLPGESISKYRGIEPLPLAAVDAEPETQEQGSYEPVHAIDEQMIASPAEDAGTQPVSNKAYKPAPEPDMVPGEANISVLPSMAASGERAPERAVSAVPEPVSAPEEREPQTDSTEAIAENLIERGPEAVSLPEMPAVHASAVPEMAAPQPGGEVLSADDNTVEQATAAENAKPESPDFEERERIHDMNVAAVFGGDAVEDADAEVKETPQPKWREQPIESPQGSYSPEGGEVEHEEIDDDEAEPTPLQSEDLEGYQLSEFEEEITERGSAFTNGNGISAAEVAAEETEDEEYEFNGGDESGYEFEESELSADSEEEDEGDDEEEVNGNGHAELRAPAGTAGYQQRTERPHFDRNSRDRKDRDRGRRGGRRMRGGPRREAPRQLPMISDLLKEGQEVLIQIAKEPIGKKGARITSHIALPGRFLVFMPTVNHIGVSRKISSDEERQRLKRIVASERENGHGGFIVRTAAAHVREEELRADIRFLKHLWNEIRTRADNAKSPALIYHDLNLVERVLRDQVTQDFSQIWVDNEQEYERVVRFASRFQPGLLRRIKLYTKDTPLFEQFGIQEEINKSLKAKVWLKSGGYIVINQTEALVAIDINTGKYVGKTQRLEDTIVKTNIDAIKEIVRQVRLRDLGGIIVIDFIDMDERKNRQKVMQALEEALKSDRAPSKVLQFNDFGLVAITRKRVKQSLERTLGTACPYCSATGFVKSVQTVCNEIYTEMRKLSRHVESRDVTVRVNPEVAKELKGGNGRWISELEELVGRTVLIKSDATLHQEQFDINL